MQENESNSNSINYKKGMALMEKANLMRKRASCNGGYGSTRKARVESMMIGRADALESKALKLMFS
jgi:hypothetical protein